MRYFDQSSSPILVLPPQLPPQVSYLINAKIHQEQDVSRTLSLCSSSLVGALLRRQVTDTNRSQPSFNMGSTRPSFTSPFTSGIQQSPVNSSWSSLTPTQATPGSAAGRKRSRDEAASNLEDDYFPVQPPAAKPEPDNEDEWEYGEGMVLIKKGGYNIEAGSQTGTWAEEKAEQEKAKAAAIHALSNAGPDRPALRAAKSQRLNLSATPAIIEEVSQNGTLVSPESPERHLEPTVDDFTRHLGIGWSSINQADSDIQAAARGWAKFIENHFPVTDAKIRLQSKGLASYLVEANEGYFLFGEDLKQGRLVSTSLDRTWVHLQGATPIFEGDLVMEAGETPKVAVDVQSAVVNEEHVMTELDGISNGAEKNHLMNNNHGLMDMESTHANGVQHITGNTVEVDMDMS
jgi:hypothetical protein